MWPWITERDMMDGLQSGNMKRVSEHEVFKLIYCAHPVFSVSISSVSHENFSSNIVQFSSKNVSLVVNLKKKKIKELNSMFVWCLFRETDNMTNFMNCFPHETSALTLFVLFQKYEAELFLRWISTNIVEANLIDLKTWLL